MSHFDPQLKATLAASLDVNGYSIIGKPETGTDGPGGDLDLVGGAAASTQALVAAQQQDRYTGVGDFGTFVGGDGAGGTAYVAAQTITLSDGSVITVGSVDGNGDVLTFIVTTSGGTTVSTGVTLTQTSTSGTGAGFTLTPQIGNVTGSAGGNLILIPGAGAGSGSNGEIQLAGNLNVNDFNITSTIKDGGADHDINIFPGLSENDETTANDVNITGGALDYLVGGGTVSGGDVNITGGGLVNRNNNATGGGVNIVGASLPLQTTAEYLGQGGDVLIRGGGVPDGNYAYGGNIRIQSGDAYATTNLSVGGDLELVSGSGYDISGNIILIPGGNDAGATQGIRNGGVIIQASSPSAYGVTNDTTTALRFQGLQANSTVTDGRILDNYVALKAPDSISPAFTLTLPATDSTGTQALVSDGSGTLSWATAIASVVEDTSPQLGGQLDVNGNAIGDGTLELITFTETGSAVNQVNIANAATGSGPTISAAGGDTNTDLNLSPKGTGKTKITSIEAPLDINTQTGTTYGPVLADAEKMITLDNASAITVTIPANSSVAYPVGTKLNFMQLGAGQVTVAITTDTLNVESTLTLLLAGQYAVATAFKVTSTTWVLFGNLEAA